MSQTPVTAWFPGHVDPVRIGIYEREWPDFRGRYFSYWDGNRWGLSYEWDDVLKHQHSHGAAARDLRWRGTTAPGVAVNPGASSDQRNEGAK